MRRDQTVALLQALAGSRHGTGLGGSMLAATGGVEHGVSDPRLAPPPSNPPQPTGAAGTTNPGIALINAYQQWLRRTGREQDPLAARVGQPNPRGGPDRTAANPLQLLRFGEGNDPFRRITHGANAGQMAQTYDLGNGKRANVYFDEHGRRRVNVYQA